MSNDDKEPETDTPEEAAGKVAPASGDPETARGADGDVEAVSDEAGPVGAKGAEPAVAEDRMDLPKWNRARVKRKPRKGEEQDAFQGAVRQAGKKAVGRAPLVLGLAVLVAASIGGVIWWNNHQQETRAVATRTLATAVGYRARGQVADVDALTKDRTRPFPVPIASDEAELQSKVQSALDDVNARVPDSAAAEVAALVRGSRLVEKGDFADAESAFRSFVEAQGADHTLAFLAQEGILAALEGQGDLEGALAQADVLVGNEGDFYRDQALWHRARLLEKLGRQDEALEVYRQYVSEYPLEKSSFARKQVRDRLSELDPALVPAEPAPPPGAQEIQIP